MYSFFSMPQEETPRHYSTKLSDISACDKSHNLRRITSPTKRLRKLVLAPTGKLHNDDSHDLDKQGRKNGIFRSS